MSPGAGRVGHLADVLVGQVGPATEGPPVDALAGFDVVAQFSHNLLNLQIARSLAQHGVSTLRAYVPWGTATLPASLQAAVPRHLRLLLATVPARLEVQLNQPSIAALRWPIEVGGAGGGSATAARRGPVVRTRTVEVAWDVEIDVLVARPDLATSGPPPSLVGEQSVVATTGGATTGGTVAADDGSWERITLGVGQALTSAQAKVDAPAGLWRFGMILDFSEATAAVNSDDSGVVEFLTSDAGKALLVQALAPLRAAVGVRLSPVIAPAGALATAVVTRSALPAFTVSDLLLADRRGEPVLSLCAQLAGVSGGVPRLVQVLLAGQDFAYAASESVLRPAYEGCWQAVATGLSFVGIVTVDVPVNNDPNVTATGDAQVLTSFADKLTDVAIKVTSAGHGDAVRLVVDQQVQVLAVWDHEGKQISDLGDLAKPVAEPTVIPISLFETSGAAPNSLNPNFKDLLLKLVAIQVFPTLEPFPARPQSVTGYCSASTKTLLVRWTLRNWRDDVLAPTPSGLRG